MKWYEWESWIKKSAGSFASNAASALAEGKRATERARLEAELKAEEQRRKEAAEAKAKKEARVQQLKDNLYHAARRKAAEQLKSYGIPVTPESVKKQLDSKFTWANQQFAAAQQEMRADVIEDLMKVDREGKSIITANTAPELREVLIQQELKKRQSLEAMKSGNYELAQALQSEVDYITEHGYLPPLPIKAEEIGGMPANVKQGWIEAGWKPADIEAQQIWKVREELYKQAEAMATLPHMYLPQLMGVTYLENELRQYPGLAESIAKQTEMGLIPETELTAIYGGLPAELGKGLAQYDKAERPWWHSKWGQFRHAGPINHFISFYPAALHAANLKRSLDAGNELTDEQFDYYLRYNNLSPREKLSPPDDVLKAYDKSTTTGEKVYYELLNPYWWLLFRGSVQAARTTLKGISLALSARAAQAGTAGAKAVPIAGKVGVETVRVGLFPAEVAERAFALPFQGAKWGIGKMGQQAYKAQLEKATVKYNALPPGQRAEMDAILRKIEAGLELTPEEMAKAKAFDKVWARELEKWQNLVKAANQETVTTSVGETVTAETVTTGTGVTTTTRVGETGTVEVVTTAAAKGETGTGGATGKLISEEIGKIENRWARRLATYQATKQALYLYAKENLPLVTRGKILATLKNVKTENQLQKAILQVDNIAEQYDARVLKTAITKELANTAPKKQAGILRGKYTPEIQRELNAIKANIKGDRAKAWANIEENINKQGDMPDEVLAKATEMANMVGIQDMGSQSLKQTLANIRSLKETGWLIHEAKRAVRATEMGIQKDKILSTLTGGEGLKPGVGTVPSRQLEPERNWAMKQWIKLRNGNLGWDNFMDLMSKFDRGSLPYRSDLSIFGSRVHIARVNELAGSQAVMGEVSTAYREAFGVSATRTGRRTLNRVLNQIHDDVVTLGTFTNNAGEVVTLKMTRGQMRTAYMQMLDPTLDDTFRTTMKWTDEIMNAVKNGLTKEDKALANWQMGFYSRYHDTLTPLYRELYGIDMPKNAFYSPIARDIESEIPEYTLFLRDVGRYASVTPSGIKARVATRIPLLFQDADDVMMRHITQMEHWKAWAITVRDLRRVFMDKEIQNAISQYHGHDLLPVLRGYIDDFARGGMAKDQVNRFADALRRNFTRAILGMKPAISLKQIPSLFGYMTEMPTKDFFNGIANFWKNPVKNYRLLLEHSPYLRQRFGKGFERDIAFAMRTKSAKTLSQRGNFLDWTMGLIRMGDKYAVVQGQWAKFVAERNAGKTIEEAMRLAEQSTRRTQPTFDIETLAPWQKANSWMKLLTMFQNQPNKYVRMVADNARNLRFDRGSRTKAIGNILLTWCVLPSIWQAVADGFHFNKMHQLRAAGLGPINYFLIFGQLSQSMYGWVTGEPYDYTASPVFSSARDMQYAMQLSRKMIDAGQDPTKDIEIDDAIRALEYYSLAAGKVAGAPTPYLVQVERGMREGEPWSLIFSPYILKQNDQEVKVPDEGMLFTLNVYAMQMYNRNWDNLSGSEQRSIYNKYPHLKD